MTYKPTDARANRLLDLFLGASHDSTLTGANVYAALFTGTETANDGTGLTEVSGNGYARVQITNDNTSWPAASSRSKSNGVAIVFPQPSGSWGTVTTGGLYTASTAGTLIITTLLSNARTPGASSDPPAFGAGTWVFTVPS